MLLKAYEPVEKEWYQLTKEENESWYKACSAKNGSDLITPINNKFNKHF